jgi:hypothetical protein
MSVPKILLAIVIAAVLAYGLYLFVAWLISFFSGA